ncbi:MAG: ribosomal protein S18-alanine N-acetyltransferase [Actinomycetota bacterium]
MFAVRQAVAADLARVLEIARATSGAAQWTFSQYEKMAEPAPDRLLLVLHDGRQAQGFIAGARAGDDWEIENIAVDLPFQRRGLGSQLLCEFLNRVRQPRQAVLLEVRESNVAGRKLYEKMGFVQVGRRTAYYRAPEEDALVMKHSF